MKLIRLSWKNWIYGFSFKMLGVLLRDMSTGWFSLNYEQKLSRITY
jgi:hypothetical protein